MRNPRLANQTSVGLQQHAPTIASGVPESRAGPVALAVESGRLTLKPSSQSSSVTAPSATALQPIRVAIIIASKLERLGWGIVVQSQSDMELVGQFSSLSKGLEFLASQPADVSLVDESMLTPKSCEELARRARLASSHCILVAPHPIGDTLGKTPWSSAFTCLLKGASADEMVAAIRAARGPGS